MTFEASSSVLVASLRAERDSLQAELEAAQAELGAFASQVRALEPVLRAERDALACELKAAQRTIIRLQAERSAPGSAAPGGVLDAQVQALRVALAAAQTDAKCACAARDEALARASDRDELQLRCQSLPRLTLQLEEASSGEAAARRALAAARRQLDDVAALTPALEALRCERDELAAAAAAAEEACERSGREVRELQAQMAQLQVCLQRETAATRTARRHQADAEAAHARDKAALVDMHAQQLAAAAADVVQLRAALRRATGDTSLHSPPRAAAPPMTQS